MTPNYLRPNTEMPKLAVNFVLNRGGVGDYINFIPAFKYVADVHTHITARIFAPPHMVELYKFFLKGHNISVYSKADATNVIAKDKENAQMISDPMTYKHYINATGAHLIDLGFMYYAGLSKAPVGYDKLPHVPDDMLISYAYNQTIIDFFKNTGKYVVMTPGATADARAIPAQHFNKLIHYVKSKGYEVVFLGKANFTTDKEAEAKAKHYFANFNTNYDYHAGVDLREKTTLIEALDIMDGAMCVIGLDNGLLHLAACTTTPVIFGYNIVEVEHRVPRRVEGDTYNITLSKESLPCIGCQSHTRFVHGHKFTQCLYGDYLCLDKLFHDDAKAWKNAIDLAL